MTHRLRFMLAGTWLAACALALPGCARPADGEPANQSAASPQQGGVEDPVQLVRAFYPGGQEIGEAARPDEYRESQDPVLSPRLRSLFLDDEEYAGNEVGRLAFNWITGAQDDDISSAEVTAAPVEGEDRQIVTARFANIGQPTTIHYYFEKMDGRWYLDDVMSPGTPGAEGMAPWTLSLVLKYGG